MTRAFVAIRPPPHVLDAVEARVGSVPMVGARRTTREQWHITVQFLGDDADIDAVAAALAREPFAIEAGAVGLGGAAALGSSRRARIVALLPAEGDQWLRALAARLGERLAPLGYGRDGAPPFKPHLTLARFRTPTDVRAFCAAIGPEPVGSAWRVDEILLFESTLASEGARHEIRARVAVR